MQAEAWEVHTGRSITSIIMGLVSHACVLGVHDDEVIIVQPLFWYIPRTRGGLEKNRQFFISRSELELDCYGSFERRRADAKRRHADGNIVGSLAASKPLHYTARTPYTIIT